MLKPLLIFLTGLFAFQAANAQTEKDTLFSYMKNPGQVVANKDSADYLLFIMPADSSSGKKLYPIVQYYLNGKNKLIGQSLTRSINFKFQGGCISFFPNGRRKWTKNYDNGNVVGDEIEYYPNGKTYCIKSIATGAEKPYTITTAAGNKLLLKQCRDSTGIVIADGGNGKWLEYDDNFSAIIAEGPVEKGLKQGEWHGINPDSTKCTYIYEGGNLVSGTGYDKNGTAYPFKVLSEQPSYPKGMDEFIKFFSKNFSAISPNRVKQGKDFSKLFINNMHPNPPEGVKKGNARAHFTIEKDGSLSNIRVDFGFDNLNTEIIRVIKLSSPWKPATLQGKPITSNYSFIVPFSTTDYDGYFSAH